MVDNELYEHLYKEYRKYFKLDEREPKLYSNKKLKEFILKSDENAKTVYRALAVNIFTWRAAGSVVANIKGSGDYQDYYCCGQEGTCKSRKVWRLLKNAGVNILGDGKNYTWNWIQWKTIWRLRWKRMDRLMNLVILFDKEKNKKRRIKIEKKINNE